MRVLFVSPYVPSAVRVRPYQWIRALARLGHRVHLVALRPPEDRWAPLDALNGACESVDTFDISRARTLINGIEAVFSDEPFQLAYSRHRQAIAHIGALARSGRYDIVHIEHLRGCVLAQDVRTCPVVFDAVDSITALFEQAATHAPSRGQRLMATLDVERTRRFEASATGTFQRVLVTSDRERRVFTASGPAGADRVVALTNGVDLEYFTPATVAPAPEPLVLFSGKMSYHANDAAARWLLDEIMPRVWGARPDARLLIAGKDPSRALLDRREPRVEVTGYLPDLREAFGRAWVSVAPLRYGAGIQNKVLEAMACGVPVVTTPQVAASLRARHGEEIVVGHDAAQLAAQIVELLANDVQRARQARLARTYVEQHHDWTALGRQLAGVYDRARTEYLSGEPAVRALR